MAGGGWMLLELRVVGWARVMGGVTYFELGLKVFSTPRVMPSMLRGCWVGEGGGCGCYIL